MEVSKMINVFKKNKVIRSLYSTLPETVRKGYKTYKKFRHLVKATEYLNKDEIQRFQFNKLQTIVHYAWKNIQGYSEVPPK